MLRCLLAGGGGGIVRCERLGRFFGSLDVGAGGGER
jgi:hypothetical protein